MHTSMRHLKRYLVFLILCCLSVAAGGQTGEGFRIDTISDALFERIKGKSYPQDCKIDRSELRYLTVKHYDGKGKIKDGELICNKQIAKELLEIFKELFENKYPIESIRLIDDFDANDELSMQANNTSCFCYRAVAGSAKLSAHARGMAVDINPLYNPCVRRLRNGSVSIQPKAGKPYADRSRYYGYTLRKGDLCYQLFTKYGFRWGGDWRSLKDYQHFEK